MSERVLIIDDEEHIRRMMRLTLEAAGYVVGEAQDGSEGLIVYADGSAWDAVVLDQRMPGIDGLEVLQKIKERDPGASVIMATAYASIELAVDAMKLGASDFVRKPMTPEILRDAVAASLAKSKAAKAKPVESQVPEKHGLPLVHTITMNGFEIVRPADVSESDTANPRERVFKVKNPRGWEREVIVEIPSEVVAFAERITRRPLPTENSFWTYRAERALAAYLWNEGRFPDHGLKVSDLTPEDLDVAARWERDQ